MDEPPSFDLGVFFEQGLPFLIATISLFLVDAFASTCEAALFSLSPADREACKSSPLKSDRTIGSMLENPRLLQVSFLVVEIFTKIGFITILTFWLRSIGFTLLQVTVLAVAVCVFCLFLGALLPKIYGRKKGITFARMTAGFSNTLCTIASPFSKPLLHLMKKWERNYVEKRTSAEELSEVLELATGIPVATEGEKGILQGIVNFGTLTVKEVMRPKSEISALSIDLSFGELMQFVNKSGFSRIPVYRKSLDNIEGVLYIKDLLPFLDYPSTFEWQKLLRPVFFISQSKKIDLLLKDFQEKRIHMAIARDDHNMVKGLVTLEDLIEEIIGEINDEFDEVPLPVKKPDQKTYIFDGRTSLFDLCTKLGINYDDLRKRYADIPTLGDLMFELTKGSPKAGDEIRFGSFTFVVESADHKRIKSVSVKNT